MLYTFRTNEVAWEFGCNCEDVSLSELERGAGILKEQMDFANVVNVSIKCLAEDYDVVWIQKYKFQFDAEQDHVHTVLKCANRVL